MIRRRKVVLVILGCWFVTAIFLLSRLKVDVGDQFVPIVDIDPRLSASNGRSPFNVTAYLQAALVKPNEDVYASNMYNEKASEAANWNRDITDGRHSSCGYLKYPDDLPSMSVIFCFHNEGRPALLRSVVSVIRQTPEHLLKDIILVDDFSDNPDDGFLLANLPKVKYVRNEKREGLIRSRIKGAGVALGDVITFLDSHIECEKDWALPLLNRIKQNSKAVVAPVIDIINMDNFEVAIAVTALRGGFQWNMNFKWEDLKGSASQKHLDDPTAPILTPTIAGGLFSIQRSWFYTMGTYDESMDIWGGENLEISFRTWLCGGSLEIIPCSRVAHVFRKRHPYTFPGGSWNVFQRNSRRVAEVWMDEYKVHYYDAVPNSLSVDFGDISERLELKKKLKCRPFRWFLENIYPELEVPKKPLSHVYIKNPDNYCVDKVSNSNAEEVGLYPCHHSGGNQLWSVSEDGSLKNGEVCIILGPHPELLSAPKLGVCDQNFLMKWRLDQGQFINSDRNWCLMSRVVPFPQLYMNHCDKSRASQWELVPAYPTLPS